MTSTAANGSSAGQWGAAEEQQPLLGRSPPRPATARWRHWLAADVQRDKADIVLLLCYIITGLLDSSSISIFGSFVSMQTGEQLHTPKASYRMFL